MGLARHFFSPGSCQEVSSTWYPKIEEPIKSHEKHYSLVYILKHRTGIENWRSLVCFPFERKLFPQLFWQLLNCSITAMVIFLGLQVIVLLMNCRRIYINGKLDTEDKPNHPYTGVSGNTQIGTWWNDPVSFPNNLQLDTLFITNKALDVTASEYDRLLCLAKHFHSQMPWCHLPGHGKMHARNNAPIQMLYCIHIRCKTRLLLILLVRYK